MSEGEVWQLFAGEERVADLLVTGGSFPWLEAELQPESGFEQFRPLFVEELKATGRAVEDDSWDLVDQWYYRIRTALRMTYPDGRDVPEFLLHVDGVLAWWRWSDEPFDE